MKKNVDGVRIEMTAEEIAERQAEEKAYLEGTLVTRMGKLRNERNILLAQTDWMGSSDFTMSNDWKTYRQALRDITTQTPVDMALSNITFPTKPS
tara:strand:- start:191 stop:475 length:285 start_codon:yes stop_codon:yes gene_type:complete